MKNLAGIFLFGVALVALCGSSGEAHQVQFTAQPVKVINNLADGPYIPVANDPQHPMYVVVDADKPAGRASYEYKVDTFSPPVVQNADGTFSTKIDLSKLQPNFETFLNSHSDWEAVSVPTSFAVGPNIVAFRRQK